MDRDDAGTSDRSEEARQGDTGMIGSESEEPGPGRDTSLTEPDPVAASGEEPRTTVAMSEGDPMATRLGSHVEGAGVIGYDVAAAEEGATQATRAEDRPGYEPERSGYEAERPVGDAPTATGPVAATAPLADERDPGLAAEPVVDRETYTPGTSEVAAEPVVDQGAYEREAGTVGGEPVIDRGQDERTADPGVGVAAAGVGAPGGVTGVSAAGPGVAAAGERVEDVGPSDSATFADEPVAHEHPAFATEDAGAADRSAVAADDPARFGTGDAMAAPAGTGSAGYEGAPGGPAPAGYEGEPGGAGMAGYQDERSADTPATYTGEEADVTGRPEYADRSEGGDQALYQEEPQRMDRPGGGGSLFTDEEPERLDRPGPQEPGVQEGVYDQEADQARQQRPSGGR